MKVVVFRSDSGLECEIREFATAAEIRALPDTELLDGWNSYEKVLGGRRNAAALNKIKNNDPAVKKAMEDAVARQRAKK